MGRNGASQCPRGVGAGSGRRARRGRHEAREAREARGAGGARRVRGQRENGGRAHPGAWLPARRRIARHLAVQERRVAPQASPTSPAGAFAASRGTRRHRHRWRPDRSTRRAAAPTPPLAPTRRGVQAAGRPRATRSAPAHAVRTRARGRRGQRRQPRAALARALAWGSRHWRRSRTQLRLIRRWLRSWQPSASPPRSPLGRPKSLRRRRTLRAFEHSRC